MIKKIVVSVSLSVLLASLGNVSVFASNEQEAYEAEREVSQNKTELEIESSLNEVEKKLESESVVNEEILGTTEQGEASEALEEKGLLLPDRFPTISSNEKIGSFFDSQGTTHALGYPKVSLNSSKTELTIRVKFTSENKYFKDEFIGFELYKATDDNRMVYDRYTRFNTYGIDTGYLNIKLDYSDYKHQEYIYMVTGAEHPHYTQYFSDSIIFRVKNPYYQAEFLDVDSHEWYYSYIYKFVDKGYLQGYSDGTFRPNNPITRAEFVKVVNRTFGLTEKRYMPFWDVIQDWQKDEVAIGVEAGYLSTANKNFRPNDPITREEASKIVGVVGNYVGDGKMSFEDQWSISDYARLYVDGLVEAGILDNGKKFRPKDNITRAEAVKILQVASEK